MGDRGNIIVKSGEEKVFLYTHWYGHDLPAVLQNVLKRKARWDDPPYLARMIFSEMIKNHIHGETGYGIWPSRGDGGVDIEIDIDNKTISYENYKASFEDFISLESPNDALFTE